MDDDDNRDGDTESLLDRIARETREDQQMPPYSSTSSGSCRHNESNDQDADRFVSRLDDDLFEHLIRRVRLACSVDAQILAMRTLSWWLDDFADQLHARDSIDFHRSADWH